MIDAKTKSFSAWDVFCQSKHITVSIDHTYMSKQRESFNCNFIRKANFKNSEVNQTDLHGKKWGANFDLYMRIFNEAKKVDIKYCLI